VFCKCSIDECKRRDPKGLYSRARKGEITEFTGVSAPYEEPRNPEIVVEADRCSLEKCAEQILQYLEQRNVIHRDTAEAEVQGTSCRGSGGVSQL
jgi:adenylylsulfate kinase